MHWNVQHDYNVCVIVVVIIVVVVVTMVITCQPWADPAIASLARLVKQRAALVPRDDIEWVGREAKMQNFVFTHVPLPRTVALKLGEGGGCCNDGGRE